jgi:hypothetical protein
MGCSVGYFKDGSMLAYCQNLETIGKIDAKPSKPKKK